jgi:hypothetical protein
MPPLAMEQGVAATATMMKKAWAPKKAGAT